MSDDEIDFLDGLEPSLPRPTQPIPSHVPSSVPVPATPVIPAKSREALKFAVILIVCAACSLGSVLLFAWMLSGRGDSPQPSADAMALGRSFAPILAGTLADGFDAGAKALESGKTIGESDAILKATFDQGRKAAFDVHAGQAIRDLTPDGTEISDNAKRNALVSLFTGFAKGLRKAK